MPLCPGEVNDISTILNRCVNFLARLAFYAMKPVSLRDLVPAAKTS